MKKLTLSFLLLSSIVFAHEINCKIDSIVKHHMLPKVDWNEGFNNKAKGIEFIYDKDNEAHGFGVTYLHFINSFYNKTIAKGFVYRYKYDWSENLSFNTKTYALYQEGYYGNWKNLGGFRTPTSTDNRFWTPLVSLGVNYSGFTIDGLGTQDTLHAMVVGYAYEF